MLKEHLAVCLITDLDSNNVKLLKYKIYLEFMKN